MLGKNLLFLGLIFFIGCKKAAPETQNAGWEQVSKQVKYRQDSQVLQLNTGGKDYTFQRSALPFKRIIFLNSSLLGYVTSLHAEDRVVGVSSPEYIYSDKIQQLVKSGKIQNVGSEQKYDVEKIIALKPDAVFTNRIANFQNTYDILTRNGIQVVFLNEYLEETPLEKSAYLRVFGKLLGLGKQSDTLFAGIEKRYRALQNKAATFKEKPLVIANELYGSQWYMPGGRTITANYIHHAGGRYILETNSDTSAVPLSFEQVYAQANGASVWVNVGNHRRKAELLAINPNYARLPVYSKGRLYALSGRERGRANDFFESGVVLSDAVLKDYISIFHPEAFPGYTPLYLRELK